MQRIRMSLPYFKALGWEPVVVCVQEDLVEGYRDPLLEETYPPEIKVYKVGAWPAKITRKFGLGSLSMRSFFHFRKKGNELLSNEKFDLVYFSTTAFHVCRLGPYWKRKFKVPFIIDMQDPWRNDFYLDKPANERPPKFFISYNIDKYLEAATIPFADGIISVSEGYRQMLMQRYASLKPEQFAVIPFGVSKRDFEIMEQHEADFGHLKLPEGRTNIIYIGRGGHDLSYSLEIIFSAFRKGLDQLPEIFSKVFFSFIGTSYAVEGKGGYTIKPVAKQFGVGDYVSEMPGRISYFETLYLLKKSDVLLVPGSTDTSYTASKIYPYIMACKPLLAVFYSKSSVVDVLEHLQFGKLVKFDSSNTSNEYTMECLERLKELLAMNANSVKLDLSLFYRYTAESKAQEQVKFFEKIINQAVKN